MKQGTQSQCSGTTHRDRGWELGGGFRMWGDTCNPWLTHVDVWQEPSQYCNYPPIKINKFLKNKKNLFLSVHTLIGQSHHYHYFIHQWNNDQCQIFIFSFDCHSLLTTFRPRHQPPPPCLTMLRGFFVASLLALPSSFPNQRLQESCEISHFPKPPMSR